MITLDDIREWYKHFGHLVTPEDVKDRFPELYNKIYEQGFKEGFKACCDDITNGFYNSLTTAERRYED